MPITPVAAASKPTSAAQPSATAMPKQQMDQDMFLKLLVTQLKYQNPASPMDPAQLMQQTAQLTLVDKLNQLVKLQEGSAAVQGTALAASVVGHQVTYNGPNAEVRTGKVSKVRIDGTSIVLHIGSDDVALSDVTEIGA